MTKNRSMRIAILVLALALLTSCFVGSTFAKYTSESSGTATVTVADWSFDLNNGTNIVESNTFTFGLFNTIKEADTTTTESDVYSLAPPSLNFQIPLQLPKRIVPRHQTGRI